jgi:hypothetical protein
MVQRITIYGWAIPRDPRTGQKGSGALVDLVYFIDDDNVRVSDIFQIIESAGYFITPKRIGGRYSPVEQDKVIVEDWNRHITIGIEKNPPGPASPGQGPAPVRGY